MKPIAASVLTLLVLILLVAATTTLRSRAASAFDTAVVENDRYYLPPAGWLRLFSLGYTEAAADVVWVKTVIHFGKQMTARDGEPPERFVMNYLLTAVELDPRFRSLYTIGSTLTMFQNGGAITRKSLDMAIELLERGTRTFPNDGEIFFSLGFIHHYEMLNFIPEDPENPITKEHLRLGRYYFSRAALMDNAPPYAGLLSASLMSRAGVADMVVAHLKAMLIKETDPRVRAELIAKLREESGKAAERDILETEKIQAAWRRDFPFVPFELYLVLRTETPIEELINPLYFTDRLLKDESSPKSSPESKESR